MATIRSIGGDSGAPAEEPAPFGLDSPNCVTRPTVLGRRRKSRAQPMQPSPQSERGTPVSKLLLTMMGIAKFVAYANAIESDTYVKVNRTTACRHRHFRVEKVRAGRSLCAVNRPIDRFLLELFGRATFSWTQTREREREPVKRVFVCARRRYGALEKSVVYRQRRRRQRP